MRKILILLATVGLLVMLLVTGAPALAGPPDEIDVYQGEEVLFVPGGDGPPEQISIHFPPPQSPPGPTGVITINPGP